MFLSYLKADFLKTKHLAYSYSPWSESVKADVFYQVQGMGMPFLIGFFLAVPFLIWGGSIPLYVLHLYLTFRFSKGVTIGLGIVESLVSGLALGADDYICKPFGVSELRARIAAHLRRERREHSIRISFENASFNLSAKQLAVRNHIVPLTKGEYEICEFLAKNRNQVFTKEQIFEHVFGYDSDSNDNTIATHIKNIRTKLQEFQYMPIKTVWGVGYKWET